MLFDSHAHLNFEDFQNDWQQVIADCQKENVGLINVGSQLQTSRKAVEIADQYSQGVYAAVGHHPIHAIGSNFHPEAFDVGDYKNLIKSSKKILAIGETGLDFFHDGQNFGNQKNIFIEQINLAKEFDLPVIVHARNNKDEKLEVYDEILKIIRQQKISKGEIHCFLGTVKQALEFVELGFYVGFTGIITFPKTENLAEVVKSLPLDAIIIETDCPWLAPAPFRGQRNLPQYVKYVGQKIAEIRQLDYNKVEEQTYLNATNLFKL